MPESQTSPTTGHSRRHRHGPVLDELGFASRFVSGKIEPQPAVAATPPRPVGDLGRAPIDRIAQLVCCLLTVQGASLADLTPAALLHYGHETRRGRAVTHPGKKYANRFVGLSAWNILHQMGHFPPGTHRPCARRCPADSSPSSRWSTATRSTTDRCGNC